MTTAILDTPSPAIAPAVDDPHDILSTIASDYRYALKAEAVFVRWEQANKSASCDEFEQRFVAWVEASLPFVRKYHIIEERFPDFIRPMKDTLAALDREFRVHTSDPR